MQHVRLPNRSSRNCNSSFPSGVAHNLTRHSNRPGGACAVSHGGSNSNYNNNNKLCCLLLFLANSRVPRSLRKTNQRQVHASSQQAAHTHWRRTNAHTRKYTDTHVWLIRQCVRGALAKFSADFFFLFSVFLNRPPSD